MAQRLNMMSVGAFIGMLLSMAAGAETFSDPTRPPQGIEQQTGAESAANTPRLTMIRMSEGRASAIVDGQEVVVGSQVGEMRVMKITEAEVVLKGKHGSEVLKLFAEVAKRPAGNKSDANASRKAGK